MGANIETFGIGGFEEIIKNFDAIKRIYLYQIAASFQRNIKRLTPVDTGNLRAKIFIDIKGDTVEVGTNVEYAVNVEFGHLLRNGGYQKGRFMFKRGINQSTKEVEKIVENYYKELEKILR